MCGQGTAVVRDWLDVIGVCGNCESRIQYACAPASGWLQRVRHNTYTVCYVRLVVVHHFLALNHFPRAVHSNRPAILHNCYGPSRMSSARKGATSAFPSYDDLYTRGTAHSADTPWGTAKGRRQFRCIPANAKVTRRKTTLRWNTRGEMMTPIEKRKG